jgi:GT2 family glycosyltransferase
MNIHIVVVAYGLADDLLTLVWSANAPAIHWHIFLHSQFPDVVKACSLLAMRKNVRYYPYGVNRGLAKSWNEGLINAYQSGADVALIANDDAIATDRDIAMLVEAALFNPNAYLVSGWGRHLSTGERGDMLLSLAAINPVALDTIGCFDENFFPIYYEDIDYYRRAALAGLPHVIVTSTDIMHAGSKSLYTVPGNAAQHDITFRRNQLYYEQKWGGDKGSERFTVPFNDAQFGLGIEDARRHTPYPGYDRTDQEVVTI